MVLYDVFDGDVRTRLPEFEDQKQPLGKEVDTERVMYKARDAEEKVVLLEMVAVTRMAVTW